MSTPGATEASQTLTSSELQEIIRSFSESDMRELRLSVGDVELLLSRNEAVDVSRPRPTAADSFGRDSASPVSPRADGITEKAPSPVVLAEPRDVEGGVGGTPGALPPGHVPVRSQAVGVFYRRPSPDEPPYVEVGSVVAGGDPVGIMEVMKMFTTVRAEAAGTVVAIDVADGTLVEYHQVLMVLDTSA